jgi:hypothetical protein
MRGLEHAKRLAASAALRSSGGVKLYVVACVVVPVPSVTQRSLATPLAILAHNTALPGAVLVRAALFRG